MKTMDAPSSLALPRHCQRPSPLSPSRKFQISSEKLGQYFSACFVPILASEHLCDKLKVQKYQKIEIKKRVTKNHSMVQSPTIPAHQAFTQEGGGKDDRRSIYASPEVYQGIVLSPAIMPH